MSLKRLSNDTKGFAAVEATFIFPIMIVLVLSLYLLSIYMCTKSTMQSSLQEAASIMTIQYSDSQIKTRSDGYIVISNQPNLNPYRHCLKSELNEETFEVMFNDVYSQAFFDNGKDIEIKADINDYIVYKEIVAEATKVMKMPINLSAFGVNTDITIKAYTKAIISDPDELIRNVDIAFDVAHFIDGKLGITDKIGEAFSGIKEFFAKKDGKDGG